MNLWQTPFLIDKIKDNETTKKATSFILENLQELKQKDNLFFESELKDFFKETIEQSFDVWLNKFLNLKLENLPNKSYRMWLTDFNSGYNMINHNHSGASLSAIFYLLNDDIDSGKLVFFDPRSNSNRGYNKYFNKMFEPLFLSAEHLSFVVFPSFVYHQVTPFFGKFRLAMPVDLFL